MCEFISWIEKDNEVLFLTNKDIKALQRKKWNKDKSEMCGHGAIRFLYGLGDNAGRQKEYTDFSTPDNFPKQIIKAIKAGKMTYGEMPRGLINNKLFDRYKAKRDSLYADYQAKRASLYADYQAKRDSLYADYQAKRDSLDADYQAKRAPLYADYQAKRDSLDADYQAKNDSLDADYQAKHDSLYAKAWELFANPKNRTEKWK